MNPDKTSDKFPVLVERQLYVVKKNQTNQQEVVVQIGTPYWVEKGEDAACPVAIRGLMGRVKDIHGLDLMDALTLAIKFVDSAISGMQPTHQFFWPDGEPY